MIDFVNFEKLKENLTQLCPTKSKLTWNFLPPSTFNHDPFKVPPPVHESFIILQDFIHTTLFLFSKDVFTFFLGLIP